MHRSTPVFGTLRQSDAMALSRFDPTDNEHFVTPRLVTICMAAIVGVEKRRVPSAIHTRGVTP